MSKIIRAPRPAKNWTEISNDVLRDKSLSYRARGILARLLSNADGFAMNADDLAEESPGEGRDAVRKSLSELQNSGYLQRVKSQDERGRWRTDLYIYDTPQTDDGFPVVGLPTTGLPTPGKPSVGKPVAIRNNKEKKHKEKQPQQPARARAAAVPAGGGGGGAFDQNLIQAAAGLGLSEQALKANAQNANDDQLQILLELYKSPPPELRNSAAWAATLARRASDGALTAATTPAPVAPTVQVWRPEEQPPATPEIKAAALERLAKLSEQMRIKPKQPPARFKQQAQG